MSPSVFTEERSHKFLWIYGPLPLKPGTLRWSPPPVTTEPEDSSFLTVPVSPPEQESIREHASVIIM